MQKLLLCFIGIFFISFTSVSQALTPKNWTFLIYINGNNNLDSFGELNIKSMEQIGSDDQVNVVVQWASFSARKAVRMLIQKSTDPLHVTSPVIEDLGLVDMGDYQVLQNFIKWGVEHYPAQHYFIDVWNHGSGWHRTKMVFNKSMHSPILNDISFDDFSGNFITTEQLGKVMTNAAEIIGHKVDIYGSDACLMSMAEVANEMSNSVNYFVGSQEVEPAMGWPYGDLLKRWTELSEATPEQVSKILVDAYVKSYQGGSSGKSSVTFSALDLNKLNELDKSIAQLSAEIRTLNATEKKKVLQVANKTQAFYYRDYKDINDFAKRLIAAEIAGLNPRSLASIQEKINDVVVANQGTERYKNATGVSFWLPVNNTIFTPMETRYHGLEFDKGTQWGNTLGSLLQGVNQTIQ